MLCGRAVDPGEAPACRLCWHRLPRVGHPRCARCGAQGAPAARAGASCRECAGWSPHLRRASAPFRMEGDAARIVRSLKFGGWFGLAPRMAVSMSGDARRVASGGPAVLVPVPLAPARRRERGFDQAALLADGLAAGLGWTRADLLERPRAGRPQARLGRRERLRNVDGAFRLRAGAASRAREGRPVVLVDDVVSTGATAAACAEALARGSIEVAGVVSFARA